MRHHGINAALQDFGPSEYFRVVSVFTTLAEGRLVVCDDIRPGEAEQIRPIPGSGAELNQR
jgi:hypothetical protein